MFFSFTWGFEEERIEKSAKTRLLPWIFVRLRDCCTCSVTSGEVVHKTICDAFAGSLLRVQCRFATDYNLVRDLAGRAPKSIMYRYLACAVLLAQTALGLVPTRHLARPRLAPVVASMPDGLEAWGCDDVLWTQIPPGAKRDLTRFARDGVEDLARNRLQTMREVISFVDAADDAPWEKGPWDTAVITWEADQAHQEAERKAAEKAAKAAAAKAKREAAAAAKAAAEA